MLIRCKKHFSISEGKSVDAPMDIIVALAPTGVIDNLEQSQTTIRFRIPREEMVHLLSLHGRF